MTESPSSRSYVWLVWTVSGGAGFATLVVGVLVLGPVAERKWAPFEGESQVCVFCGEYQSIERRRGHIVMQEVTPTDVSRWVQSLHPYHTKHNWVTVSTNGRGEWFGDEYIGCGGPLESAGSQYAYLAKQRISEAAGEQYLAEFHAALALPHAELLKHVHEMSVEITTSTAP